MDKPENERRKISVSALSGIARFIKGAGDRDDLPDVKRDVWMGKNRENHPPL